MGFILFCVLMSQVILEWIWPTDVHSNLHRKVEEKKRKLKLKK